MKQVTLSIPDNKFKTFLAFIKTLDYVQVEDNTIPQWQMEEVNKRLADYKNNPEQAMDFDTAMDDIDKDL